MDNNNNKTLKISKAEKQQIINKLREDKAHIVREKITINKVQ